MNFIASGSGIIIVISTSKIKNTTASKKKWREKGSRDILLGSYPHSKGEFFSRLKPNLTEIEELIRISANDSNIETKKIIIIIIPTYWTPRLEIRLTFYNRIIHYDPHQYMFKYKNNQTTSTKCQYQAAASNPKWCILDRWPLYIRIRQINKNVVPIITWIPWNPVAIKKVEP